MGEVILMSKPSLDDLRIERPTVAARKQRSWLWLVAVGMVAIGALIFWRARTSGTTLVHTAVAREIAGSATDRTVLNASGYVTARRQATVSSKVTGKVTEVLIEEGMKIEQGQVLARLDSSNVEKALHLAEAQLESSRRAIGETEAN